MSGKILYLILNERLLFTFNKGFGVFFVKCFSRDPLPPKNYSLLNHILFSISWHIICLLKYVIPVFYQLFCRCVKHNITVFFLNTFSPVKRIVSIPFCLATFNASIIFLLLPLVDIAIITSPLVPNAVNCFENI